MNSDSQNSEYSDDEENHDIDKSFENKCTHRYQDMHNDIEQQKPCETEEQFLKTIAEPIRGFLNDVHHEYKPIQILQIVQNEYARKHGTCSLPIYQFFKDEQFFEFNEYSRRSFQKWIIRIFHSKNFERIDAKLTHKLVKRVLTFNLYDFLYDMNADPYDPRDVPILQPHYYVDMSKEDLINRNNNFKDYL
ncbi:hypothetical protein M9Y10_031767 [Tritrichomonas musculus]|uniref:Uncharacterized protein n=1 Tax=Tritrichomonas musculus TaxID=1915356 RepID=A0ABR2H1C4_9EUKA